VKPTRVSIRSPATRRSATPEPPSPAARLEERRPPARPRPDSPARQGPPRTCHRPAVQRRSGCGRRHRGGRPLVVRTGKHTESPQDKFIVRAAIPTRSGGALTTSASRSTRRCARASSTTRIELFVRRVRGRRPGYRRSLRAYRDRRASVFCDNLFIRPARGRLDGFDFTIIDAPSFKADPRVTAPARTVIWSA
jgi:hypothetical protein